MQAKGYVTVTYGPDRWPTPTSTNTIGSLGLGWSSAVASVPSMPALIATNSNLQAKLPLCALGELVLTVAGRIALTCRNGRA